MQKSDNARLGTASRKRSGSSSAQPTAVQVGACRFQTKQAADTATANHAAFKATMDAAATADDKAEAFASFFNLKG